MDKLMLRPVIPADGMSPFVGDNGVAKWQGRTSEDITSDARRVRYEALWDLCGHKLRVMITLADDKGTFAKVQAHDGKEWKFLVDIQPKLMVLKDPSGSEEDLLARARKDADTLLLKACEVLNPRYAEVDKDVSDVIAYAIQAFGIKPELQERYDLCRTFIKERGLTPAFRAFIDDLYAAKKNND